MFDIDSLSFMGASPCNMISQLYTTHEIYR